VKNRDFRYFDRIGGYARSSAPFDSAEGLAVTRSSDRFGRHTGDRVWGLVGQHSHYSEAFSGTAMGFAGQLT
jgi:hypothetical protein